MTDNTVFASVADLQRLIRGTSNSQSLAMLNSVMAETIGMTMYNAVSTQHNAQMLNSAATTSTCAKILSVMGLKAEPPAPVVTPTQDNNPPTPDGSTPQTDADTQDTPADKSLAPVAKAAEPGEVQDGTSTAGQPGAPAAKNTDTKDSPPSGKGF